MAALNNAAFYLNFTQTPYDLTAEDVVEVTAALEDIVPYATNDQQVRRRNSAPERHPLTAVKDPLCFGSYVPKIR